MIIKYLINFSFVFVLTMYFTGCKDEEQTEKLWGNWNLVNIYVDGKDILNNDELKKAYKYPLMRIDNDIRQISIETNRETVYSKFSIETEEEKIYVKIYRSTIEKFNGRYLVNFLKGEKIDEYFKGKELIRLKSDNITILGSI